MPSKRRNAREASPSNPNRRTYQRWRFSNSCNFRGFVPKNGSSNSPAACKSSSKLPGTLPFSFKKPAACKALTVQSRSECRRTWLCSATTSVHVPFRDRSRAYIFISPFTVRSGSRSDGRRSFCGLHHSDAGRRGYTAPSAAARAAEARSCGTDRAPARRNSRRSP